MLIVSISTMANADTYEEKIAKSKLALGQPIERIELVDLAGSVRSFDELHGQKTVLYFFASWCAPCYKSLSNIEQVSQEETTKVNLIAVALDDDLVAVKEQLAKTQFTGEVWVASSGREPLSNRLFGNFVKVLPYVIRLDENTSIIEQSYDISKKQEWQRILLSGASLKGAIGF